MIGPYCRFRRQATSLPPSAPRSSRTAPDRATANPGVMARPRAAWRGSAEGDALSRAWWIQQILGTSSTSSHVNRRSRRKSERLFLQAHSKGRRNNRMIYESEFCFPRSQSSRQATPQRCCGAPMQEVRVRALYSSARTPQPDSTHAVHPASRLTSSRGQAESCKPDIAGRLCRPQSSGDSRQLTSQAGARPAHGGGPATCPGMPGTLSRIRSPQ